MTIESTLETVLGDTYPIYPLSVPKDGQYPCFVFQRISTVPIRSFDGNEGNKARIQLSCWGEDYGETETLADYAGMMLDLNDTDFVFAYKQNEFDDQEENTKQVRKILEFFVTEEI